MEAAAESSEQLMNKYWRPACWTKTIINVALPQRTIAGEIQPMLCGTAFKNKGV